MGGKNMCEVMECLRGVSLEGPPKITKKRVNGVETTVEQSVPFNAYSMALLLAIAFRCNDGSEDSECWGSYADLQALTHTGRTSVRDHLAVLEKLNLITRKHKVDCSDGRYHDLVCKLNHAQIAHVRDAAGGEVGRNTDEVGRNTDEVGRNTDDIGRNTATNHLMNYTNNHIYVSKEETEESEEKRLQKLIAARLGVDIDEIGLGGVHKRVVGRSVRQIIVIADTTRQKLEDAPDAGAREKIIGKMFAHMSRLKKITAAEQRTENAAYFEAAAREQRCDKDQAKSPDSNNYFVSVWVFFLNELALNGLPRYKAVKTAYENAFRQRLPSWSYAFRHWLMYEVERKASLYWQRKDGTIDPEKFTDDFIAALNDFNEQS